MTLGEAVAEAARILAAAGIEATRREARLLLALAAAIEPATVLGYPERPLDASALARFEALVIRRAGHEPLSRIAGRREFWSLDFELSPETLDPRPDSETLVEAALARIPDRASAPRILDFGTGTGCLLLALLRELPRAVGFGIDRAPGAVATARRNAAALGLAGRAFFACGDWDTALRGEIDLIVANPPYVPRAEIAALAPEVTRFDPRLALDGGEDGLDAYRVLAPAAHRLLGSSGIACFELGRGQAGMAAEIFQASGLDVRSLVYDLNHVPRCIVVGNRTDDKAGDNQKNRWNSHTSRLG